MGLNQAFSGRLKPGQAYPELKRNVVKFSGGASVTPNPSTQQDVIFRKEVARMLDLDESAPLYEIQLAFLRKAESALLSDDPYAKEDFKVRVYMFINNDLHYQGLSQFFKVNQDPKNHIYSLDESIAVVYRALQLDDMRENLP